MPDLTISTPVDNLVSCANAAAMRTVLGLGTAATATLASLLSDFTYTAATRILSSASTGASATLTLADGTNPGLMASADYTLLNTITTKRLLGRNTGSTGAGEHVTVDQLLDWVAGTPGTGDILYRGAGSYARLAIGTTNALLAQGGSGAPVWTTAPSLTGLGIASGSLSSSTPITLTQTWNNAGTTFKAATITITDTNSASGSLVLDIKGGSSGTTNILNINRLGVMDIGSSSLAGIDFMKMTTQYATCKWGMGGAGNLYLDRSFSVVGSGSNVQAAIDDGYLGIGTSGDTRLYRDAAYSFAIRNSTNAQSLAIYNTYTSSSNYERLRIYGTALASFTIAAERDATPTGSYRGINIMTGGLNMIQLASDGSSTTIGNSSNASNFIKITGQYGTCNISQGGSGNLVFDKSIAVAGGVRIVNSNDLGAFVIGTSEDTYLCRGGAARAWAMRGTGGAHSLAIYGSSDTTHQTNPTNYERLSLVSAAGTNRIAVEKGGTGTYRQLDIETGGSASLSIDANGNVYPAKTASTSMADGFLYIPAAAGTPTAAPPTAVTGHVLLYYDTTNNKLYTYNGAWKSVTLA